MPTFEPAEPEPVPVSPAPSRPRSGSSRAVNLALGAAVLVAVAGVSFAAGRATAPASPAFGDGSLVIAGAPGSGFVPGGSFDPSGGGFIVDGAPGGVGGAPVMLGGGGPAIEGTVEKVTGDSITILLESGQTVSAGLDSNTTYHLQADAAASDVSAGKTVILRLGGEFRPGGSDDDRSSLGTASDVTVVP